MQGLRHSRQRFGDQIYQSRYLNIAENRHQTGETPPESHRCVVVGVEHMPLVHLFWTARPQRPCVAVVSCLPITKRNGWLSTYKSLSNTHPVIMTSMDVHSTLTSGTPQWSGRQGASDVEWSLHAWYLCKVSYSIYILHCINITGCGLLAPWCGANWLRGPLTNRPTVPMPFQRAGMSLIINCPGLREDYVVVNDESN